MAYIEVTIENGDLVRQGLENLALSYPKIGRLQIYRRVQSIYRRLGIYPSPWPGQLYKRTYTARRSRRVEKIDKGYRITFDPVDKRGRAYGVILRGAPLDATLQARYHQGRWEPFAMILDEEVAKLPQEVINALKKEAAVAAQETQRGARK